ncbi:hypothetical protein D3C71_2212490 [compost metagenome]
MPEAFQARGQLCLAEQVVETVIQTKSDESADGEEGQEFDHRFEGNGQDHAAVVFGHIQAARTKHN